MSKMKGINIIVFFVVGLGIGNAQNSCPSDGHIYHSYPHESDCTQFYKCDWGVPYGFLCPIADSAGNRLIFNPVLQVCDWPEAAIPAGAVCVATPTPSPPTSSPPTPEQTTLPPGQCPPNNEYYHSYPHETDCHKFYVCDWGLPVEKICPIADAVTGARLVFNPELQVCDWPEAAIAAGAVCAATPTPSPPTPSPPTPEPTTLPPGQCPPNNEYYHSYPHETDCHKFYVCDWGLPVEKICPIADAVTGARLVFNPELQVCDWPEAAIAAGAVCAVTPTPSPPTPSPTTPEPTTLPPGQCPPNNEYYHSYPHETDCHKFYVCDWGLPVEKICPIADAVTGARLVFNPELQVCDWPEAAIAAGAVCAATPTPSPPTSSPTTPEPTTLEPATTLPPGQCPPNNEYYHSYPHETDCHKFYVCDWGLPVEKICPIADTVTGARLVFNPELQVCDWPEAAIAAGAVCAATPTPSPPTPSPTTPEPTTLEPTTTLPPGQCPPNNEYYHSYPHETDCHKFYVCDWGLPVEKICPIADAVTGARLVFNPELQVCDWPEAAIAAGAVCAVTPTPSPPTPSPTTPEPTTLEPTTTLPPGQCPPNNEYYHSYPHETDCHKFYVCDWGLPVEKICPIADTVTGARLVFNPELQVCDWPEAAIAAGAVCAATPTPSPPTPSPTTPEPTTLEPTTTLPPGQCPPNNEYYHSYPHETDCHKFYVCDWGLPVEKICPIADAVTGARLVFNPELQVCDWPEAAIAAGAVCAVTPTPSPPTPSPTTPEPTTLPPGQCPPNNEYYHSYPHETDCHKFYVCDWGLPVEKICPIADAVTGARLVFNPELQVCDWPEAAIAAGAVCAATPTPTPPTPSPTTLEPTTLEPTTTLPPGQCPPNNEYYHSYPHETDCHKFYVCDWGLPVEKICPIADAVTGARLVFNPELQVCDWPEAAIAAGAVCAATPTPTPPTPSPTTPEPTTLEPTTTLPPGQCPPNNEYYHSYPHETDCHKFYVCDWGLPVEKICPIADAVTGARLVFNPELQVCDWPEAAIAAGAVCAVTPTPSPPTPSPTTPEPTTLPPGQCPPNNEYYHSYPHETDCHKFYVCDWGLPVEKICPIADAVTGARLVFNPELQVCDWPEAAIAAGAVCAATPTPTPPTPSPTTLEPTTLEPTTTLPPGQCPPNNEYYHSYPHETDCHKFYVCDWGLPVEKICPIADAVTGARLVFNPELQVCDWPEAAIAAGAVCAATPTPTPPTPSPTTPEPTTLEPTTTLPPGQCPPNNEYYHSYPHETDCHKFYVCDWGLPVEKICPIADAVTGARLVFNPELQVCDWPEAAIAAGAVCAATPTPTPPTPSPTTPEPTTLEPTTTLPPGQCPPNNEYYHSYPHETDCHKFYVCDWGLPVEKICPIADAVTGARLVFNPELQVCDWPEAAIAAGAVCAVTPTPSPPTPSPTTPEPTTLPPGQCPPNNEYYHSYPHETDCHKFYVCDWGLPVEKICPIADAVTGARLVFNPELQVCDWPEAAIAAGAVCAATPTPTPPTPSPTTPEPTTLEPTTTLPPGQCPPNNEYYHSYPHETDCHKFYVCDWGLPVETICPIADAVTGARLVFNPELQVCDWPEAAIAAGAVCAATPTPSPPTPSPTTPEPTTLPPGQCPPNNEYYHSYPHETDCHKFYVCDWGLPVEKICPIADAVTGARLVFNPELQVCDWPEAAIAAGAVCAATPTPSPPTPSPPTPSPPTPSPPTPSPPTPSPPITKPSTLPPSKCPPNNEYYHSYPHETNCHKFYVCDWGVPKEKICPIADSAGNKLVFNPKLQVCDWRNNAIANGAVC